jgi:Rho-type GTPase-activating protein 1/2
MCFDCIPNCSACGGKIEGVAMTTVDQILCTACFQCKNCKQKIEGTRYAKTSKGIFCMACHEHFMELLLQQRRATKLLSGEGPQAGSPNESGNVVNGKGP